MGPGCVTISGACAHHLIEPFFPVGALVAQKSGRDNSRQLCTTGLNLGLQKGLITCQMNL